MSIIHRLRLLLVPIVMLLAVSGLSGAAASPPKLGSGTFTTTSAILANPRSDDGNTIFDVTATVVYTGTFTGTSTYHGTLIFHADGSASFHDVETFTGSVNGVYGTLTFKDKGGAPPPATPTSPFLYHATNDIVGGTGGLDDLRGAMRLVGTVQPPSGPVGTYTIELESGTPER